VAYLRLAVQIDSPWFQQDCQHAVKDCQEVPRLQGGRVQRSIASVA